MGEVVEGKYFSLPMIMNELIALIVGTSYERTCLNAKQKNRYSNFWFVGRDIREDVFFLFSPSQTPSGKGGLMND